MKVLVTGIAGFIGFHLSRKLSQIGHHVIGVDNLNNYYDVKLKLDRLKELGFVDSPILDNQIMISQKFENLEFMKIDIGNKESTDHLFNKYSFDAVINLAAQAGVRYSLSNPQAYIDSNIIGFANILESCKNHSVKNLVYASSSSVYGMNGTIPFHTSQSVDHPISLYAASKKSNELMAHVYSHLFDIQTTGLRFFTVYGPWGRPDMASFIFTRAILEGKSIQVFNNGEMMRDFTYIDDIISGIIQVLNNPAKSNEKWDNTKPDPASSSAPYRVFNIGNSKPIMLLEFISLIEKKLQKKAIIELMPMQPGDVQSTYADITTLKEHFDYHPKTEVEEGIGNFVDWYLSYYK